MEMRVLSGPRNVSSGGSGGVDVGGGRLEVECASLSGPRSSSASSLRVDSLMKLVAAMLMDRRSTTSFVKLAR
jgi:hypothetical protein